jgi:hypothetical protein
MVSQRGLTYRDLVDKFHGVGRNDPPEQYIVRPTNFQEAHRFDQEMDEVRAQHRSELIDQMEREALATRIDPPAAVRAELERILSVEGLQPPWLGLRRRVRQELNLVQDQLWRQIAREAEGARASRDDSAAPGRSGGGGVTRLVAWARRHVVGE